MDRTALYRTVWRWHFYAGLFVVPFILLLSLTGAIYLFKPQIDRWEERDWRGLSSAHAVSADAQVRAALAAVPGAAFNAYRIPENEGDAAIVKLTTPARDALELVVSPQGKVLATVDPETRITPTAWFPDDGIARRPARRAGSQLGDHHDPQRSVSVVAARARGGRRPLAPSWHGPTDVLARPSCRNGFLGRGSCPRAAVQRPPLDRWLGHRLPLGSQ